MPNHSRFVAAGRAALVVLGLALVVGGVSRAQAQTSRPDPSAQTPSAPVVDSASPAPSATQRDRAAFDVPILMYHLIDAKARAGHARPDLVVPPALFEAQMQAMARDGWHSITLEQLGRDLKAGTRPARRRFVLTIDDGHEDGYANAWPVLHRYGFVATFFVISERIGRPGYITAAQLRTLAAAGNEIADHSATHIPLAGLSAAELHRQVCGAAGAISVATGRTPATFAYPFGNLDSRVVAAVRACPGMLVAVTVRPGTVETWASRFELPRLAVGPATSPADLLAMIARSA
jgi:peptidoglycan/xylan/chitin deacetylase (PgdA/CDA1 family)